MKSASSLYTFSSPCLSCVLFCLLHFSGLHTHTHSQRESQSCTHWLRGLSGCHSCNRPKSDRCSVLVAVSLTAVFSLSFIPGLNCITAQRLQTFRQQSGRAKSLSFGALLEGLRAIVKGGHRITKGLRGDLYVTSGSQVVSKTI